MNDDINLFNVFFQQLACELALKYFRPRIRALNCVENDKFHLKNSPLAAPYFIEVFK